MLPVDEIRRLNLLALIRAHGSQRALADVIDKAPAQISQWVKRSPNEAGKPRTVNNKSAREIEAKLPHLPSGWMDHSHDDDSAGRASLVSPPAINPDYVRFQLLEGAGGMGDGILNEDHPEVIRDVEVAKWEVRKRIGFVPEPDRVRLLTGRGPSMRPRIEHGDVVMVDTMVDGFDGDAVYVIAMNGETQIKMLQMRGDGLYVVSANPDYPPYRIEEVGSVHVRGKVLAVLGVREL